MDTEKSVPSDVLLCLLREELAVDGPRRLDDLAGFLVRIGAELGDCPLWIVCADGAEAVRRQAQALAAACRARGDRPRAIEVLDETAFVRRGAAAPDTVFYIHSDSLALPGDLAARPKFYLLPTEPPEIVPWPAGRSLAEAFLGDRPPLWTRHFAAESEALQNELNKVRTVLRHAGEPGIPRDILITGPTGSGKSYFAKCLPALRDARYDDPTRPFGPADAAADATPYLAGNCASLTPDLADALLFGAVRGAYTGCDADRTGLIESAGSGILFLDEVGELPLETQGKLLTALEERTFRRLGDTGPEAIPRTVACTIVFGTNADLDAAARLWEESHGARGFRRDLLWRINACHLKLPSFRERLAGCSTGQLFLDDLVATHCRAFGLTLTADARRAFDAFARDYAWSGNHRDALHIFQSLRVKLLVQDMGSRVSAFTMRETLNGIGGRPAAPAGPAEALLADVGRGRPDFERRELGRIFDACRLAPNRTAAGRAFYGEQAGRNYSDTFGKKLARFGLRFDPAVPGHLSRTQQG